MAQRRLPAFNDDGTITIPLVPKGEEKDREVVLREPTIVEMKEVLRAFREADEALPKLDELQRTGVEYAQELKDKEGDLSAQVALSDQLRRFIAASRERQAAMFSGEESPHAAALVTVIGLLSDQAVEVGDLYAWAGRLDVGARIIRHYTDPFGSPDADAVQGNGAAATVTT